jgi:membrane protease YdiL (CAAX protease family)
VATKGYFEQSRDLGNSLILVAPLLVIYEAGLLLGLANLNGVDFITILTMKYAGGVRGLLVLNLALLVGIALAAHARKKDKRFDPSIVPFVLLESTLYALVLGIAIAQVLHYLNFNPAAQTGEGGAVGGALHDVVVSLGAGVNEELFFRVGLFNLIAFLAAGGKSEEKKPSAVPVAIAMIVSSVLFSLAHYLGSESFLVYSFVFRTLAGALFCAIYVGRGLAVAVYTHAVYDMIVLTLQRH